MAGECSLFYCVVVSGVLPRLVIIGEQSSDVMVRLDNILYHPLMKFNDSPQTCAPYCFPTSKLGQEGVAVSGVCCSFILPSSSSPVCGLQDV